MRAQEEGHNMTLGTEGPEETRALGALLAEFLEAGDFIALDGELASGKTCLVQGVASGLAYRGHATSPTFTLLHFYEGGRLPLYHFDLYRIEAPEELEGLGYEEYFYGDGVCAVEWSGLAADYLPDRRIGIRLEKDGAAAWDGSENADETPERRRITVTLYGGEGAWRRMRLALSGRWRSRSGDDDADTRD